MKIMREMMASVMVAQPYCHLLDIFVLIGGTIYVFGKVNVKALKVLAVIPISGTARDDRGTIVFHQVDFGDGGSCL